MIERSVGSRGANARNDVLIVQTALNFWRSTMGFRPIAVDGVVGPETIGAITKFQQMNRLIMDGRVDPDGRTIQLLRSLLPEEAAIFGPTIAQLLSTLDFLTRLSFVAPASVQGRYQFVIARMGFLRKYRHLAPSGPNDPPILLAGFPGGPPVIGVTGIEETAAAISLLLLALAVASMLLIMSQSPEFRKAVEVRAKELDRLLSGLKLESVGFFESAVELVNLVLTESSTKQDDCRQSPTFTPSPECEEAIRKFVQFTGFIVGQIKVIKSKIAFLLALLAAHRGLSKDVREVVELRGLVRRALEDAFTLQFKKADMKDKCNCRDI